MTPRRRVAAALLAALSGAACTPDRAPRAAATPRSPHEAPSTPTLDAPPAAATASACPADMVEIQGSYCTRVVEVCLKRRKPLQCAEFQAPSVCEGRTLPKHYCIDRYQFPNKQGSLPTVMISWTSAKAECDAIG